MTIPYKQSFSAYLNSSQYLKCWGPILDFSSLGDDDSYLKSALIDSPSMQIMTRYLSMVTKNRAYLFKDETNGKCLKVNFGNKHTLLTLLQNYQKMVSIFYRKNYGNNHSHYSLLRILGNHIPFLETILYILFRSRSTISYTWSRINATL